jgi:hypothetical protein
MLMNALRPEIVRVQVVSRTDYDADLSYLTDPGRYSDLPQDEAAKYAKQDAERMATYGNDWWMVGVYAVAELRFATPQGGWQAPFKVRSCGLWGIESDSDKDYFREVGADELNQLAEQLEALGLSHDEVKAAIDAAEWNI